MLRSLVPTLALFLIVPALGFARSIPQPGPEDDLESFRAKFVDGTFDPLLKEKQRAVAEAAARVTRNQRAASGDIGEIAVLEDDGTLIVGGVSNSDEIVRRFYETHPDQYGQIFLNFNFSMDPEAGFAFESNVANDVQGIGLPIFNSGAQFGTVNLHSYLNQNDLLHYPNFTVYNSILGQESGHRFGSFIELQDCQNKFLLGRDCAHWNFYNHSQGSTLEGNDWTDNGDGTFSSANAASSYGEIDEYLFGLRLPTDVTQPLFVIENPTNCMRNGNPVNCPSVNAGPSNNWTVTGTRTDYTMADIIAKYGARVPDANSAPNNFRVAFILVVPAGQYPPPAADLNKLDGFRTAWEAFFLAETNGRGTMETRLYLPGEPPHPAFTASPLSGIPGTTVQFTDDTRNGPATSWLWDFGDGNTSTLPSPAHTYTTPGTFDVTLTVSNANGSESRTRTSYIQITARPPQTEFTADVTLGASPLTVNFTDQSSWQPSSWVWDFGDGSSSTQQNPSHTYASPGAYTVVLRTSNAFGTNARGKQNYITTGTQIYLEDFETGATGWTHGANAGTDDWELGPPLGQGGDPAAAFGGTNVFGTDLGSGNRDGLYEPNSDTWLRSPSIDGSGATNVALSFQRWLTVEDAFYDQARVEIGGNTYFQNPVGSGSEQFVDGSWVQTVADITPDAAGNPAFDLTFTITSDGGLEFGGWNIDDVAVFSTSTGPYTQGPRVLAGPGHGAANPNQARLFDARGVQLLDFMAYGAGSYGTNVGAGDIDYDTYAEILTAPGPGSNLGPQVRGFNGWDGSGLAKLNYYAYGTLRFGANVAAADLDGDTVAEIVTGPGAGAVFGPHVRAWNFDAQSLTPIARINYFSYGTLKYGVLVASADLDSDSEWAEILSGAGPGAVFGAHLRGWNFDAASLTTLPNYNAFVFAATQYGVNVGVGDYNISNRAEAIVGKGPSPTNDAAVKAFLYNNSPALSQVNNSDLVAFTSLYGVRVAGGYLGDRRDHLVAGPGPDPAAASRLMGWTFQTGFQPDPRPGLRRLLHQLRNHARGRRHPVTREAEAGPSRLPSSEFQLNTPRAPGPGSPRSSPGRG